MSKGFKFFIACTLGLSILAACSQKVSTIQPLAQTTQTIQKSSVDNKFGNLGKDALFKAQTKARQLDSFAELVKVEGDNITETGSASSWFFHFKLSTNKLVKIDGYGNAKDESAFVTGSEIGTFDWKIDSDKVAEIAKKNGIKKFPIISITLENKYMDAEWELRTWEGWFKINAVTGDFRKTNGL